MRQIFLVILIHQFVFCDSRIHSFIYTDPERDIVFVDYYGNDDKIITSQEQRLFNITDENLKKGADIDLGKEPDDVFLKSPAIYGDLHKKYNWKPVKRRLEVKKAEVIDVISGKAIIRLYEHVNNTPESMKCNSITSEIVEDIVTSVWSKDGLQEDKVYYIDYTITGRVVMYHNRRTQDLFQNTPSIFGVKKNVKKS